MYSPQDLDFNEMSVNINKAKDVKDLKDVCLFLLDKLSEICNDVSKLKDDVEYAGL